MRVGDVYSSWGGRVYAGSAYWDVCIKVTVTSIAAASVGVNVEGIVMAHYAHNVYANGSVWATNASTRTWSGSLTEGSNSSPYDTSSTFISYSDSYTRSYGSDRTVSFNARYNVTGGYNNGTSTASVSMTIPARPYSVPRAPKELAVSRASDAQHDVSWTVDYDGASGAQPWHGVYVDRRTDDGEWVNIATVSWSVANYSDKTTEANRKYEYGVRSYNSAGASARVAADAVYTTPAPPSSVAASVVSGTTVQVAPTAYGPYATHCDIQRDVGEGWEPAASGIAVASLPYTDSVSGTAKWRARVKRGPLESAWAESAEITTITPPLAPSVSVAPRVSGDGSLTVSWVPSHPDGSAQTAAQVEVTEYGQSAVTKAVSGAAASLAVAVTHVGAVSARVRTKGAHADWGAWSAAVTADYELPPVAAFTSPATDGAEVDRQPLEVAWSITDATGVAGQKLSLLDASGAVVWSEQLATDARSRAIGIGDHLMANGASYSLRLDVRGGSTLTATATRAFTTDWEVPATPSASVAVGDDMGVTLVVSEGEPAEGAPDTDSLSVTRIMADGSQHLVASGLASGQAARDPLPPLNQEVTYRVTAATDYGASSAADVTATVESEVGVYNFGRAAESALVPPYDFESTTKPERAGGLVHFAGAELPEWYGTGQADRSGSQKFHLATEGQAARAQALFAANATGWVRFPDGRREHARLRASLSRRAGSPVTEVSVSTDEIAFREA